MQKLKVIHVGLGKWGSNWATQVLPGHPDVEVVGHVDRDPVALTAIQRRLGAPDGAVFADLNDALGAVTADAVVITVPIGLHAPLARMALEAGKHVVVEKPFTATLAEARDLVALAEQRKLTLMVSQNYRFYPATQLAATLVREEIFGKLVSVKVDFRRNAYAERSTNLSVPDPLFADMAVHHFDLMRMIIGGDPIDITARSWNPLSPYQGEPTGAAIIGFPNGVFVSYRGNWVDMGPQTAWAGEWQLDFERGAIAMTSRGDQLDRTGRDRLTVLRPNAKAEEIDLAPMELFDRAGVLHAFAETVRTGCEPAFFPAGRINVGTLAIVEAALQSAAAGGRPMTLASL